MNTDTLDSVTNITSLNSLNVFLSERDNSENVCYISTIPKICTEAPCILGIDEAGRGPVLGPMVYGIAFCPLDKDEILKSSECADSKALTEIKRDVIFSNLCTSTDVFGWAVDVISPNQISNSMLSRTKHSLNAVSKESAVGLIKKVELAGVVIEHIYVDTLGSQPEKYQAYLLNIFPNYNITVAKKADAIYPIVSAASIFAKVTRDHALQVWKFPEGLALNQKDFGSDYLNPVFGFPQLVRFSWSTASNALENDGYGVEWEEVDEDETKQPINTTSITSFFKMVDKPKVKKTKHSFFTQMCLTGTTPF
ncbi:hypothetical protein RI129_000957 [Pyrocoelia pectoralis]|uniref:Ribonuclease n=1 Tax=Pyrocoelia pectoralis TaxID=417401 RepID=A0AAN7ZWK6_9COLE